MTVHLKDVELTQNGKRWSQVMYLNYLLKFKADVEKAEFLSYFSYEDEKVIEHKRPLVENHHTYIMGKFLTFTPI